VQFTPDLQTPAHSFYVLILKPSIQANKLTILQNVKIRKKLCGGMD